ncbi:MAG: amidase [Candidatus Binataceae bacterium]|nr:amidase [Candidatus Binataceae bacterium]
MDSKSELMRLSATEARKRIGEGSLTASALAEAYLDRIAQREGEIGAWQFLDRNLVMLQARDRDRRKPVGAMHGVPVAMKDIIDTEDMPTEYGSPIYKGHMSSRDAICVAMLRAAGAIILGKTVTTEFATFSPGKTRHPHRWTHTPGGSSSGTAAAVADWHVPAGFGTQTAGSILRPAAYCGVIGYKPTFARFNYDGIKLTAPSLDTLGFMTNYFEDLHLISGVLTGLGRPTSSKVAGRTPRIGVCRTTWWNRGSVEMHQVFNQTVDKLARADAPVSVIDLPPFFDDMADAQETIMTYENAICLRHEYENHRTRLTPKLRELIEHGRSRSVSQLQNAKLIVRKCRAYIEALFINVDVLITPTAPGVAPAGIYATGDPIFERMWTCLGNPCVGWRTGSGGNGLPIGVQAVGAQGADDALIDYSAWMASHTREPNP